MVLRRLKHRCAGLTTRTPQALARVLQPGLQHLRGSCCAAASVWAEQLTEDKQRSVHAYMSPDPDISPRGCGAWCWRLSLAWWRVAWWPSCVVAQSLTRRHHTYGRA